jgi:uncharacterized protein YndB with AHSA1/START domain
MEAVPSSGTATVSLPTDEQILIVRQFDAPRHLVYRAWTTAELVRRWWAGGRGETTVTELDLRVGGRWRYVISFPGSGRDVVFHGEYREIVPDERIVTTEVWEGASAGDEDPPLNVISFTESDGRTTLEILVECASQATRDRILGTGMEAGMQEQMDLLEQVASSLGG